MLNPFFSFYLSGLCCSVCLRCVCLKNNANFQLLVDAQCDFRLELIPLDWINIHYCACRIFITILSEYVCVCVSFFVSFALFLFPLSSLVHSDFLRRLYFCLFVSLFLCFVLSLSTCFLVVLCLSKNG